MIPRHQRHVAERCDVQDQADRWPTGAANGHGPAVSRVDMHCHSAASAAARLGIQRSLGLPECATSPEEVYELAKRRGMDFVTITDHDTIDGCLEIADRQDVFISVELTAWFCGRAAGGPRALLRGQPGGSRVSAAAGG